MTLRENDAAMKKKPNPPSTPQEYLAALPSAQRTALQKLRRTITDFLTTVWRDGALFGEKPEDAFYVRIDEVLNPFSEQALGRLHIEIGVRPSYPAEFIIVRIGIWAGGSEITES